MERPEVRIWFLSGYILMLIGWWRWTLLTMFLHLFPGAWQGEYGLFAPGILHLLVGSLLLLLGLSLCFEWKRRGFALLMLATLATCWIRPMPSFQDRLNEEMPLYERAIETRTPFGDQFEAKVAGRRVVFWRWITYGIDNGSGVVYDPADRLEKDEEKSLDYGPRKGFLWKVTRLKKGNFYVQFT